MRRIPMTAREQLEEARQLGHELSIRQTGPWPEHNDPHPKYFLSCSCGWAPNGSSRSRVALNARMVWHLGQVLADHDLDQAKRNGVSRPGSVGGRL